MKKPRKEIIDSNRPVDPSRRRFLGQASCAAVGTTALFNTVLNMGMFNTLAAGAADYKGMVCLFLSGGADSFNMMVPSGDSEYAEYAATRGDLALLQTDLLPILPATPDGRSYGLHPGLGPLQTLFEQNQLAFVANVGTLVEPTTLAQYENRSVNLPLGLFSHSDQQMHWQSSVPDQRSPVGWAGRMADILQASNCNQNISMNISLSGSNIFQSGHITNHYTIGPNGSVGLLNYNQPDPESQIRTSAIDGILGLNYQNVFEKTFAMRMRGAIDAHEEFSAAIAGLPPLMTQFSDTRLSQRFRMIAQTIQAREVLGMRRQTFFVEAGGWDHHDEVIANQAVMLPEIAAALSEFQAAMVEIGVANDVTTFTASDFGRTLTSNGRGSDHAWGGNHIVMGGAVAGGDVYGSYPSMSLGSSLDTGRGRLIPTLAVDEYFADLALWFGIPSPDLELVLPNINRFYNTASVQPPIGFMSSGAPTSSRSRPIGAASSSSGTDPGRATRGRPRFRSGR
ncbi:MAG: DUF1501 domain-containing protein [Acidobacteriota bacterium]|nr:DUF1501 domain-containing protein [Acidobacteriota bacterium]MDH3784031.1 DUF1501 domain-containing protein [Acidobacteriota bacterium]